MDLGFHVYRCFYQIRPIPFPFLVTSSHESSDARFNLPSLSYDGQGGNLSTGQIYTDSWGPQLVEHHIDYSRGYYDALCGRSLPIQVGFKKHIGLLDRIGVGCTSLLPRTWNRPSLLGGGDIYSCPCPL